MRRAAVLLTAAAVILLLAGCGAAETEPSVPADPISENREEITMKMSISDVPVAVQWEDNESVRALQKMTEEGPVTIEMSMYGGFEQVGPIGTPLPRSDRPTDTKPGDLVLYSGDQLVVFYGSNSWSYTRLGHITDRSAEELKALLGQEDVTVRLSP